MASHTFYRNSDVYWATNIKEEKNKPFSKYVLIKNNHLHMTNGIILKRAKLNKSYSSGLFKISKRTKKEICLMETTIPIQDIYPDLTEILLTDPIEDLTMTEGCYDSIYNTYADIIRGLPDKYALNFHEYEKMFIPKEKKEYSFFTTTNDHMIMVTDLENREAYIMLIVDHTK